LPHYRVNAGFLPANHWLHDVQQGGGRIIGEACHFIDFITFLTGELPQWVSTTALPDVNRYHRDNIQICFGFPDGSLGTVTYLANGTKAFPKERVEVFCGGRVGVLDDFRSLDLVNDHHHVHKVARLRQDKGHLTAWSSFCDALVQGNPPPIPYEQLLAVTRQPLLQSDRWKPAKKWSSAEQHWVKHNVNQLQKGYLAVKELGLKQLVPYAAYRFRLQSGILRHATPPGAGLPL